MANPTAGKTAPAVAKPSPNHFQLVFKDQMGQRPAMNEQNRPLPFRIQVIDRQVHLVRCLHKVHGNTSFLSYHMRRRPEAEHRYKKDAENLCVFKHPFFYGPDGSRTRVQKPIPCPSTTVVSSYRKGLRLFHSLCRAETDIPAGSVASSYAHRLKALPVSFPT